MRILMLGPYPNIRGPIRGHTLRLVEALRDLGCNVTLLPWGRHSDQESLAQKVIGRIEDIRCIRRALRGCSFEMFVVKTAPDWGGLSRDIPLLLATYGLRPRTVLQFHGSLAGHLVRPGNLALKAACALLVRLSDAVLVLSSEEQRQWSAFYPRGQFYVVSNPYVPAPDWPIGAGRAALGIPDGLPILLFVGRLIEAKGIFELVEALPETLAHVPCHLLFAGDGDDAGRLKARVAALGLTDRVSFAGYLTGQALQTAYACADVFVLPSWAEGFPVAMTQAMDAGLAVVTTPIRGMADHLVEEENALFVPVQDVPALSKALRRLLCDPWLRERMSRANREKVKEFSPALVGRHYLDTLLTVAANR